jgi:hypothetical protein
MNQSRTILVAYVLAVFSVASAVGGNARAGEAPAAAVAERAAAQSYDAEAAAYRAEAEQSRREAAAYAAAETPNAEMQRHCESRAALADKLAANVEKLSAFHARRAKEIEARTKRQAAPKR